MTDRRFIRTFGQSRPFIANVYLVNNDKADPNVLLATVWEKVEQLQRIEICVKI